ncbi:hypothetical protein [Gracilimonas sp.]|uniref:hypothetical protein n=1 Tax=Gracilimonas sp. TaxID=1974203 RepID=UPI002870BDE8|nr:hypothetical protein [Gracilimonas sp.]
MDNLPRFIFYASGVFIVSAAFTLFSSEFLKKVADPTYVGTLFLLGFGLVYLNIVFVSGRRFMRRLQGVNPAPYIFGLLVVAPPLAWVNIYDAGLGDFELTFMFTVILACGLGALLGHRAGLKAQVKFRQNLEEFIKQDQELNENDNQN